MSKSEIEEERKRILYINGAEINDTYKYPTNYVSTTKYNVFTFLPISLFDQFKRIANIYFLVTAILQSIPQISPLNAFSAIAPLVFVLAVSMIREGVEDYLRYKSDQETNSTKTLVYNKGSFEDATFKDVQVGDLVKVLKDESFPCDLVMLSNSSENGIAYIETSTLDGEKALKQRQAFGPTSEIVKDTGIIRVFSMLECDTPNPRIYQFSGAIEYENKRYPLDKSQVLLGGAFLRNTSWAIGVAVYTGNDTKLRQNLMGRRFKQSQVERKVNRYIIYIIGIQSLMCLATAILEGLWTSKHWEKHEYLHGLDYSANMQGFLGYFTYFLLLNTMLPISLIVSLEILKVVQGYFMSKDSEMYSKLRDRPCKVSSFSLNEELGMVQHIFSDKTGTLTCNRMEFKFCTIGTKMYGDNRSLMNLEYVQKPSFSNKEIAFSFDTKVIEHDTFFSKVPIAIKPIKITQNFELQNQQQINEFFLRCLSLCHECLIENNDSGAISYVGQSPDEIALVDSASRIGFKYTKIKDGIVDLQVGTDFSIEKYEKICTLEFDSDRKRNSIIVRDLSTNKIFLFIKGADDMIKTKLSGSSSKEIFEAVSANLQTFAERGLRTLMLGFRIIEENEFSAWKAKYDVASTSIEGRNQKISQVADEIEKNIFLLGCTAVEDSLQEDVPKTINDLLGAGISVWMLTGDKLETAENIGKTCSLIDANTTIERCSSGVLDICYGKMVEIKKKFKESIKSGKPAALIIQGDSLEIILFDCKNPEKVSKYPELSGTADSIQKATKIQKMFLRISSMCKTVICCRVTPGQKQEVVKLMKDHCGYITLAIGDGANDVAMILEAHVGIGLYGEEGMQSVQASDYAIGEFKFLWELLLIHGRFNYLRQSEMIMYFFYKNLVFTIPQFFFAFYCAYSGQTVYDDWYITFYNMVFTALPLIVKALLEIDIIIPRRNEVQSIASMNSTEDNPLRSTHHNKIRDLVPKCYNTGRLNEIFTPYNFSIWIGNGLFHSFIVYFIPFYAAEYGMLTEDGLNHDLWSFSITSFSCVILIVNLKLSLHTRHWTVYSVFSICILSLLLYFGFILVYDSLTELPDYLSIFQIIESPYFYLSIFTTLSLVASIDGGIHFFRRIFHPSKPEILMNYALKAKNLSSVIPAENLSSYRQVSQG
ncbi:unnamed protein product [Blepharisma stoltei]|uniref:Phospholipid-transporting ATPase n=1 Tax=Blepharisma stoltei TaxID=1481888 RepID=A0AAU9IHK6_9CILI|nr:unnamed protein product [Blepharisma stoltei]